MGGKGGSCPGPAGQRRQTPHPTAFPSAAGLTVTTPYFHGGDAFLAYPPLTNIHYELRVEAELKPLSLEGLVLFSGGEGAPVADFVSLNMARGHLEFRYELGSGKGCFPREESEEQQAPRLAPALWQPVWWGGAPERGPQGAERPWG